MTVSTETNPEEALQSMILTGVDLPLGEVGRVVGVSIDGSHAVVQIELGFPAAGLAGAIEAQVRQLLIDGFAVSRVDVEITTKITAHGVQRNLKPLPGVRNIVAVASGKGGVGKSTTAVNLALALAGEGAKVGVLDADIYGPSIPLMLGVADERPTSDDGKTLTPLSAHGMQVMSIGFLIDADQPMVWRGPMVTQALNQMLQQTRWADLDYLIVDMPPGTGDIQLTLSQQVPVSGAVIVTTPQDIALLDARKGLQMFRKVKVPVLGIVENMSTHICTECGHEEAIVRQWRWCSHGGRLRRRIAGPAAFGPQDPAADRWRTAQRYRRAGRGASGSVSEDRVAHGRTPGNAGQRLQCAIPEDRSGRRLIVSKDGRRRAGRL